MRWWIDRRVTAALFLILLLLLSMGVVSYRSFTLLQQTAQWVQRSQTGMTRLEGLLTQLVGAETGQRGYLLTGDHRYLRPYLTAIESIQHRLDTLETLVQDNPTLQQHLVRLKPLIADKFAELEETIALRDDQGYEAAMTLVQTHQGQQVMDRIQLILHSMKAEAQAVFAQRSQMNQAYTRRIWLLLSVESATVAVLLALVMLKINRDVSCYHHILERLQTAETTFRRAIIDAPIPIMLHTEDGQVLQLSRVWTELTGYTEAEIPTISDWLERAYGQRKEAIQAKMTRLDCLNQRISANGYPIETRSGEMRLWNFFSAPLNLFADSCPEGGTASPRRVVNTMAIDLTDYQPIQEALHSLEEELEQRVAERTADLEQANAALEAFSHTVAHDLYAPLRTIQSFAAILLEDTSKLNPEERNSLQRIYRASQRMEAFIGDLLVYSRLERVDLPLQPVNLDRILKQVLGNLEDVIQQTQAQIHWTEPLGIVQGHPIAIEQILTNLLTNAIKFVPPETQPQICIRTEAVIEETVIRLTVQDNGIGIAAEDQERIFSIFERVHPAEIFPGSGIGLAIVQRAVERMKGRVGVESKPGQGSRFWLDLPTNAGSVERIAGG